MVMQEYVYTQLFTLKLKHRGCPSLTSLICLFSFMLSFPLLCYDWDCQSIAMATLGELR